MKKLFTVMALSLTIAFSSGLAACSNTLAKDSGNAGNGKFDELTTTESVYGFSAASAGMLISSMGAGDVKRVAPAGQVFERRVKSTSFCAASGLSETEEKSFEETNDGSSADEKPAITENPDVAELDGYMTLIESLLSDGAFNIDSQKSDREDFAQKTVISYTNMKGVEQLYVMYYNQILTGTETDDEDGETKENYSIEGVIVIDGADYEVKGEKNNEFEGDESESETELVVKLGDARYIRVEHSTESEEGETEQEYRYSVYANDKLVERSTFSYETEEDETELKMTSFKNGKAEVLFFEKELEKGEEVIKIHIGDGTSGKGYIVRIETDENGESRYVYEPTVSDE